MDLQIQWGSCEAVPIFFDLVLGKIIGWSSWVDKELSDGEFVSCLEHVEILKSIAISRNLEGFRDAKGLRHLVHRWCSFLHTFFFSVGELTITLEDVVNNFLLPMFGDENPFDISLFNEDLEVEYKLFSHFGERTASSDGKSAKMGKWVMTISQEKDKAVSQAGVLTLWLSKFLFSEFPGMGLSLFSFLLQSDWLGVPSIL